MPNARPSAAEKFTISEISAPATNAFSPAPVRIGLVNKVVPQEELMATAKKMASKIARNASYAVAVAKAAINNGYDMDIKNAVEYEANLFGMTCSTHDKTEGMTAFLEKRKEKNFTDF